MDFDFKSVDLRELYNIESGPDDNVRSEFYKLVNGGYSLDHACKLLELVGHSAIAVNRIRQEYKHLQKVTKPGVIDRALDKVCRMSSKDLLKYLKIKPKL